MRNIYALLIVVVAFTVSGCSTPAPRVVYKPAPQVEAVPVPEVQYVSITLIDGKTTKQEILDTLGTPDSFTDNDEYRCFTYTYYDKDMLKVKANIIQKDGTTFNIIIGKGEKNTYITIYFTKKGIVSHISVS